MAQMVNWAEALRQYAYWRLVQSGKSEQTWKGEAPGLRAFIAHMQDIGVGTPRDMAPEHAAYWWEQIGHLADSTQATRLTQLRSFLHYCIHMRWMKKDPTLLLRARPVMKEPRMQLTPEELLQLVDATETPRDRVLIALAVNLGLRGGEVSRLKVRDVNLVAGEITVHVDKTHEVDVMPITADLRDELTRWLAHYTSEARVSRDSYLVPARYQGPTGKAYKPGSMYTEPYRAVKHALDNMGVEYESGEGVHTVRRSMARIFFDFIEEAETFDSALLATMALLHHSRPETTLGYIGRNRAQLARDRVLRGQPFLRKLAPDYRPLKVAQ